MPIHDATPSWSGYQYQGKVSLYVFLRTLNDLIESKLEFNNYVLEIESLEDFAIKKEGNYISAHQVKAKTTANTINAYFDTILSLNKNPSTVENYLHIVKEINNWSKDGFTNTLDEKINNLKDKAKKESKEEILSEIPFLLSLKENANSIISRVKLYQYSTGKDYCGLEEIECLITDEIKKYYLRVNQHHKTGELHIKTLYMNFIGKIDSHIRDRHLKRALNEIPFDELVDVLNDDTLLERDNEYHIYVLKNIYEYKQKQIFCDACIFENGECNSYKDCHVSNITEDIRYMKLKEFEKLIMKINPQIIEKVLNDNNRHVFAQVIGIQSFFEILRRIKSQYQYQNRKVVYVKSNNAYMATTINLSGESAYYKEKICKDIICNEDYLEDLQECNVLITKDINESNILHRLTEAPEVDTSVKRKYDYMRDKNIFVKIVTLKDISEVEKELNND